MSETGVRALVFDVFGTVVDWRTSVAREVAVVADNHGSDIDAVAFADRWRGKYSPSMEPVRRGEKPYVRLDDLHRQSLREVLDEFGVGGQLDDAALENLNRAWHRLTLADSVPGLTRLKSKYILATMSNGNVALMVNMAKHSACRGT